jgi:hypothetical protein
LGLEERVVGSTDPAEKKLLLLLLLMTFSKKNITAETLARQV